MEKYEDIIKLYFQSIRAMESIESTPRDFGTGDMLFSSEIHTVVEIAKHPDCNLTELAGYLDITKGGAAKFVKKLVAKELITKKHLPGNKKEVFFAITDKGRIAYERHEMFEQGRFGEIFKVLGNMAALYLVFGEESRANKVIKMVLGLSNLWIGCFDFGFG